MNILGHAWVACHAVNGRRDQLIIGSLLPESFPFVSHNPFSFGEIHEGGRLLFSFLKRRYPEKKDLALGMLSHSVEFGADGWNKHIERFAVGRRGELIEKIAKASRLDPRIATARLHNFLWLGVDFMIMKSQPEFVGEVAKTIKEVDVEQISQILSECFKKNLNLTRRTLDILLRRIYQTEDLSSVEGLARIWARQAEGLPEKDRVNPVQAKEIIQECARHLEGSWQNLLETVTERIDEQLQPFWEREERLRKEKEVFHL